MKYLTAICLVSLFLACVEPFDFRAGNEKLLVIEGGLYDKDSSFVSVRMTDQNNNAAIQKSVSDAKVTVIENDGVEIKYLFNETASYFLPQDTSFRAKAGNFYRLRVQLPDGRTYESLPDTVRSFEEVKGFASNNDLDPKEFQLAVEHPAKQVEAHYYLYQMINYKRAVYCSECSNQIKYDVKDSTDCSSYFRNCNSERSGSILGGYYGFVCDPRTRAWNYKIVRDKVTYTDANLTEGASQTIKLLDIPVSSYARFFVEVHQSNISRNAYEYFQLLRQSGDRTGTLFDPTPPLIVGNLRNVTNSNDRALGYFVVGAQHIYGHYVDRSLGQLTAADNEVEFIENIPRAAFARCTLPGSSSPLSDIIYVNAYRTDRRPVGWRDDF